MRTLILLTMLLACAHATAEANCPQLKVMYDDIALGMTYEEFKCFRTKSLSVTGREMDADGHLIETSEMWTWPGMVVIIWRDSKISKISIRQHGAYDR